jgi:hypothetical protein
MVGRVLVRQTRHSSAGDGSPRVVSGARAADHLRYRNIGHLRRRRPDGRQPGPHGRSSVSGHVSGSALGWRQRAAVLIIHRQMRRQQRQPIEYRMHQQALWSVVIPALCEHIAAHGWLVCDGACPIPIGQQYLIAALMLCGRVSAQRWLAFIGGRPIPPAVHTMLMTGEIEWAMPDSWALWTQSLMRRLHQRSSGKPLTRLRDEWPRSESGRC